MNWKGEVLNFTVRWGLPAAAAILMALLLTRRWPGRIVDLLASRRWLAFAVTRPVFLLVLYAGLGFHGVTDYFYWIGAVEDSLRGKPQAFMACYGPLFGPMLETGYRLFPGGNGCGVLLGFVLGDALGLAATPRIAGLLWGPAGDRWACAWHLLSPMLWYQGIFWAQDEPLFVGFLALGALATLRGRPLLGGAVLALGACCTKMTFAPYAVAVIAMGAADLAGFAAAAAVGLGLTGAIYATAWLLGGASKSLFDVLEWQAGGMTGWGMSIPDILSNAGVELPSTLWLAASLVGIVGTLVLVRARMKDRSPAWRLVAGLGGTHLAFLLLAPACMSPYAVQGYFLVPFAWAATRRDGSRNPGLVLAVLAEWIACMWLNFPREWWPWMALFLSAFHLATWIAIVRVVPEGPPASTLTSPGRPPSTP